MQRNIFITEDMAERMTPPKSENDGDVQARNEMLIQIGQCCLSQQSYQLAAKKFTQAGDKLKAMQALLQSGDTEKIVFFSNVARQPKIYILAANYLQSQPGWREDGQIMQTIITFYTKAKAFESLSSFYDSCSQVEIDDYRDYEKALAALREALKYMVKARTSQKEEKVKYLQQRIFLVDRFVEARRLVKSDPDEMARICHQLMDSPDVESAIRLGDVFAMMVEVAFEAGDMLAAFESIKHMRDRNVDVSAYLDDAMLQQIHREVGVEYQAEGDSGRLDQSGSQGEFMDGGMDGDIAGGGGIDEDLDGGM